MKKIFIVCLVCVVLSISGCSKPPLEKEPVEIEDSSGADINISEPGVEQDDLSNQENQDENAENDYKLQENSSDIPSNDMDNKDSGANEALDNYKGIIMLEGMEEEVNYRVYKSEYGYLMSYDVDRFTVTSENGTDTYMAENMNPDLYTYVFINITRSEYVDGKKTELPIGNLYVDDSELNKTLSTNYPNDNVKINDYDAIHFKSIEGDDWNSLVKHVYIIPLEKNYYTITTHYFLEASEGYGVRIKAMLDTLVFEE
jgi:hypothetical protein